MIPSRFLLVTLSVLCNAGCLAAFDDRPQLPIWFVVMPFVVVFVLPSVIYHIFRYVFVRRRGGHMFNHGSKRGQTDQEAGSVSQPPDEET